MGGELVWGLYNKISKVSVIMKTKTITIREEQEEWLKENHINLSSLVREKIDEEMKDEG